MQRRRVMFHYCCRLDAAVAIRTVEIQCVDAGLAEKAAIDRFGCVISHLIIVVTFHVWALGNGCATLERETHSRSPAARFEQQASGKLAYGFPTALSEFPIAREERRP